VKVKELVILLMYGAISIPFLFVSQLGREAGIKRKS
jgi:hypothetical protein